MSTKSNTHRSLEEALYPSLTVNRTNTPAEYTPKRRVGRPARTDVRKAVPTFFPVGLRERIKAAAESDGLPMSDWLDGKIITWFATNKNQLVPIAKTHSRRDGLGTAWVAVQVILLHDTFERVQRYAKLYEVSAAGIVYTVAKGSIDDTP